MSRTTDPLAAITWLLASSDPATVIQYDGDSYRVTFSGNKAEGFYEILTRDQARDIHRSLLLPSIGDVAEVLKEESEGWLRSARYNESLATTASDDCYPTND